MGVRTYAGRRRKLPALVIMAAFVLQLFGPAGAVLADDPDYSHCKDKYTLEKVHNVGVEVGNEVVLRAKAILAEDAVPETCNAYKPNNEPRPFTLTWTFPDGVPDGLDPDSLQKPAGSQGNANIKFTPTTPGVYPFQVKAKWARLTGTASAVLTVWEATSLSLSLQTPDGDPLPAGVNAGTPYRIAAKLTDSNGIGIAGQPVVITMTDGMTTYSSSDYPTETNGGTDGDGMFYWNSHAHPGDWTITAAFAAVGQYAEANAGPVQLTVAAPEEEDPPPLVKAATHIQSAKTKTVTYGTWGNFSPTLRTPDVNGTPVAGADVTLYIDGAEAGTATTNANGVAKIAIPHLDAGTYDYKLVYAGNDDYESVEREGTLVVAPLAVDLTVEDTVSIVDHDAVLKGTVSHNGTPVDDVDVVFTLSGKTYPTRSADGGKVEVTVAGSEGLAFGLHPFSLALAPSAGNYTATTANGLLTISEAGTRIEPETDLAYVYGELTNHTVRLEAFVNGVWQGLANRQLIVKVNDQALPAPITTDANGSADIVWPATIQAGANQSYQVEFTGDSKYNPASFFGKLDVAVRTVNLSTGNAVAVYDDPATLQATVTRDGKGVAGVPLTFTIDGQSYSATSDGSGEASVDITGLDADTYTFTVTAAGPNDSATEVSAQLTVNPRATTITAPANPGIAYGAPNATLEVKLQSAGDRPVANKLVTLTVNGIDTTATTGADGVAQLPIPSTLAVNTYPYTVSFSDPDGNYVDSDANGTLKVNKRNVILAPKPATTQYMKNVTIEVVVTNPNNKPWPNVPLQLDLNGVKHYATSGPDGIASFYIANAQGLGVSGSPHTFEVSIEVDDPNHIASPVSGQLTIEKRPTVITADNVTRQYGGNVPVRATLTDDDEDDPTALPGQELVFTVGGSPVAPNPQTDATGVATHTMTKPDAGEYEVVISFAGNDNYAAADPVTVKVKINPRQVTIFPESEVITYGDELRLRAQVKNAQGNPHAGVPLAFTINGNSYVATSDGNGWAVTDPIQPDLDAPPSPYRFTVALKDTDNYSGLSAEGQVWVTRQETILSTTDAVGQYGGAPIELTARLTDINNKPLAGKTITFTSAAFAGPVQETTDAAGYATVQITPTAAGNFTFTVEFAGDSNYDNPGVLSANLTVDEQPTRVTFRLAPYTTTIGGAQLISALFEKWNGSAWVPLTGKQVTLTVGDNDYSLTTGSGVLNSGVASTSVTLNDVGTYDVTMKFAEANYETAEDTTTLTVTKRSTTINAAGNVTAYMDEGEVELTARLTRSGVVVQAGAELEFDIPDLNFHATATTGLLGRAQVDVPLSKPGTFPYTVTFAETDTHSGATFTGTLTIQQHETNITGDDAVTITLDESVTLSVTATKKEWELRIVPFPPSWHEVWNPVVMGTTLRFYSDDFDLDETVTTNHQGTASVTVAPEHAGVYKINVVMTDGRYEWSIHTITLTVAPRDTMLTLGTLDDITYGETTTLTATLTKADGVTGLGGKLIEFVIDGTKVGEATTGADGVATLTDVTPDGAGSRTVKARFRGDSDNELAKDNGTLAVAKQQTALTVGNKTVTVNNSVTIEATLTGAIDGALDGETIEFEIDHGLLGAQGEQTDADGKASVTVTPTATGQYTVTVTYAGASNYEGTSATATLTVSPVAGGGGGGGGSAFFPPPAPAASPGTPVTPQAGGTVTTAGGRVQLYIPPGAVTETVYVTIKPLGVSVTPSTSGYLRIGDLIVEVTARTASGTPVTDFRKDVVFTFKVLAGDLTGSYSEDDLLAFYWDENLHQWIAIPTQAGTNGEVTATIDHFTTFALLGDKQFPRLTDIKGHWAEADIMKLISTGIVVGRGDNLFDPEGDVTRAEFAKMIVRGLGLQPQSNPQLTFVDADDIPDWAKGYVATAIAEGIIAGLPGNRFGPNMKITREQIATMVARALDLKAEGNVSFPDEDKVSDWAIAAVRASLEKLIMFRRAEDGNFDPQDDATRAEAARAIARLMTLRFIPN